jgi:hypothetical protein
MAHPMHGDVLRGRVSPLRRRAILAEAEDVEARGAASRGPDPNRDWRLEATGR